MKRAEAEEGWKTKKSQKEERLWTLVGGREL
jgi:hypothetical protein